MKGADDISPWKVSEKTEAKQFNEENHFSLPKMSLQFRKQSQEDQKIADQRISSTIFLKPHSSLQILSSKSLSDTWGRKLSEYKKGQISSPHKKGQFRPSPPLAIKKTYKYHELIAKSNGLYARQSTPMIKQRMQMLLKAYEVQEANDNCLKSLTNEQILKIQQSKKSTKKTNIQFKYDELNMRRILQQSPLKKAKTHILDNLLCSWER